MTNKV